MYHRVRGMRPHETETGVVVLQLDCGHCVCLPARPLPRQWAICPHCLPERKVTPLPERKRLRPNAEERS